MKKSSYQAPPPKNTNPINKSPLATKPSVKIIIKKSVMLVIFCPNINVLERVLIKGNRILKLL